jgi:hypothetical protein
MVQSVDMSRIKTLLPYGSPHGGLFEALNRVPNKIALDLNKTHLETWTNSGWIPIFSDVRDISMFIDKSFDMVIATDIVEHISKDDAIVLLKEIDRVCRKIAIVFTPLGFFDTELLQPELVHSELDVHKSSWEISDFEELGYTVCVIKNVNDGVGNTYSVITGVKEYDN